MGDRGQKLTKRNKKHPVVALLRLGLFRPCGLRKIEREMDDQA